MIKMFRSTTLLYFGLIVLGVILLILYSLTIEIMGEKTYPFGITPLHPVPVFLILILWIFISAFIATRYAVELSDRIGRLYTEECDPYTYIEKYESILKRRIGNGNMRNYVLINLSSGYLSIENSQKAKQILDNVGNFQNNKAGIQSKVVFYNNLCSYFLQVNDIANAEIMLENMRVALQDEKFPKQRYDWMYNYYTDKQYCINIEKGNYIGAEEVFLIQFNREKNMLGKVVAKYQLGKIYLHFNKIEEAIESFDYVVNHGNKTYYVGKSTDFIEQCKNNT